MSNLGRGIIALALAAGMVGIGAGSAHAYNAGDCPRAFDVDAFSIDRAGVDFGDHFHIAGRPRGTAAVCWYRSGGGQVEVLGRLFADSLLGICVTALIDHIGDTTLTKRVNFCGRLPMSVPVRYAVDGPANIRQVRFRLFAGGTPRTPFSVFRGGG